MNNVKILKYEFKRLVFSKVYAAFLAVAVIMTYSILSGRIMFGTAYTAPFSKWSYSSFIGSINPFLLVMVLFFCSHIFSNKELSVRTITLAAPISVPKYFILKCISIVLAYAAALVIVVFESFTFYALVFRFYSFGDFMGPIFLFLLPPVIFALGLGIFLGSFKGVLLYMLIPLTFILGNSGFNLPLWIDPFLSGFINGFPYSLQADASGEVPFALPAEISTSRAILIVFGIALIAITCIISVRKLKNEK